MPSWIKSNKESYNEENAPSNLPSIDLQTLNDMQHKAYNLVKSHYENVDDNKEQLLLIVLGVAGTGKSYLINAIKQLLHEKCAVCAPTGKASFNIKGVTLHSLLRLSVGQRRMSDLSGQCLAQLQNDLESIEYIIIDEYSMIGQASFGWVDKRCRQATGLKDQILGGKSLILIGDVCQLPPVGDKVLYHAYPSSDIAQQGYFLYHLFDKVICLTTNQRVTGTNAGQQMFQELLMRLRSGDSTEEDWQTLLT